MSIESEQPLPSGVGLIEVAFEWVHPNGTPFGADLGALLLGPHERVGRDADFIFYNQPTSPDGAVRLGDATDRREPGRQSREGKALYVDLDTLSSQVEE